MSVQTVLLSFMDRGGAVFSIRCGLLMRVTVVCVQLWPDLRGHGVQRTVVRHHDHPDVSVLQRVQAVSVVFVSAVGFCILMKRIAIRSG